MFSSGLAGVVVSSCRRPGRIRIHGRLAPCPPPPVSCPPFMPSSPTDPYAALRGRDFRLFFAGKLAADFGSQMQNTAVLWEIYGKTGRAIDLGYVGLAQIVPYLLLAIPAGQLADRVDRRRLVMASQVPIALASIGLALASTLGWSVSWVYAFLALSGVGKALQQPARSSLLPQIVPMDRFTNAVTWNVSGFQLAMVAGPALGGFLIAWLGGPKWVYWIDAGMTILFLGLLALVRPVPTERMGAGLGLRSFAEGLAFVFRTKALFASLSLDMLAVLFAGVTAILPIFAKDILGVDADGLGWLRSAPPLGAIVTSAILTHRPPLERSGRALLVSVVGFGAATIAFGLSTSFYFSLGMLFLTGAFDMVSVVIRHTLVQTMTPDALRGRVSAVNGIFIGVSNELGAFESGLAAHWLGPSPSVVAGGGAAIGVVVLVAWACPELRRLGRLEKA